MSLRSVIGILILLVAVPVQFYQAVFADSAQDSTVFAALVVNLVRFTEWPPGSQTHNDMSLPLCVIGDNVTQQAFAEVDKKQVGSRWLKVINKSRLSNRDQCQVLYISGLDRNTSIQLLAETGKRPILTIGGDNRHFLEDGGMVAFTIIDGSVSFQINLAVVKQAGLQISSRVLKLATIFNP